MANLKRLWDTDHQRVVFTEGPSGHMCQVWGDENGNLYIYDMAQWLTYNGVSTAGETYDKSNRVELTDEEVGFYDTNEPTDLYSRDHGDEAYYQFVDYDGTVLKSGTVEEGETPTAPADPTRSATAQYTYTFAGWNPTVGPISKRTTYTATYTATVNNYTVSITSNDTDYGTVDESSVTDVPYGTAISVDGNTLTIGTGEDAVVVTATAESGYEFSSWGEVPATVTGNLSITATFVVSVSITINDVLSDTTGTVGSTVTVYFTKTGTAGLLYSDDPDILTVESSDDTGGEGFTNSVTLNVTGSGTTTLTISATGTGGVTLASDTIEIVCSSAQYSFTNKAWCVPYTPEEGEEGLEDGKYYLFCGGTDAPDLTNGNYIMLQRDGSGPSRIIEKYGIFADSKYELPNDGGNAWDAIINCDDVNNFYDFGMYLLFDASGGAIGTAKGEFVSDFWSDLEHVYSATSLNAYVSIAIQTEQQASDEDPLVTSITSDYDPEAE